jgi:hypothetical protein
VRVPQEVPFRPATPDSVVVLSDGPQTVEFKSLSTAKVRTVAGHLSPADQSTRYVVRLEGSWDTAALETALARALSEAEGLLEEIVFVTDGGVYRWKG